jgi:hypothetical protein
VTASLWKADDAMLSSSSQASLKQKATDPFQQLNLTPLSFPKK